MNTRYSGPYASSIYYWKAPGSNEAGGYLRFVSVGEDLYVISAPIQESLRTVVTSPYTGYKYYEWLITKVGSKSDTQVEWSFDMAFLDWTDSSVVTVTRNNELIGKGKRVSPGDPRGNFTYDWVAELLPKGFEHGKGLPVYEALISFDEKDLLKALTTINPEAKRIMVVQPYEAGEKRPKLPRPLGAPKFPGIRK